MSPRNRKSPRTFLTESKHTETFENVALYYFSVYKQTNVWYNLKCYRLLNWQQEGGVVMESLVSFILSVLASVVAYYICKWLDGKEKR